MKTEEKTRLTVYLPPDLDEWARKKAQEEDRTLSALAERIFRAYQHLIKA